MITQDGSHTLAIPELNVTYHSRHGAILESKHVFITEGLKEFTLGFNNPVVRILEMGLGTGLNALLTLIENEHLKRTIHYTGLELFPLHHTEIMALNYCSQLNRDDLFTVFEKMHTSEWEKDIEVVPGFILHKKQQSLPGYFTAEKYQVIYFDAFAPLAQPELWAGPVFEKMYAMLDETGILVTYCSKGEVRRTMQAAGFIVHKRPGPPGKREMVRAFKPRVD
jgi:tRNA U34 5-methylaminomethyl-2-thiouridine-forming methyltransferase MnmC